LFSVTAADAAVASAMRIIQAVLPPFRKNCPTCGTSSPMLASLP